MIYSSLPLSLSSSINYIMPFEILACGFNALGQLLPGTTDDIVTPTVIARAETSAKVLFAGWSETLLELDSKLHYRGALGSLQPLPQCCTPPYSACGDGLGLKIVFGSEEGGRQTTAYVLTREGEWEGHLLAEKTRIIAVAGNGKVITTNDGTSMHHPTIPSNLHYK